MNILFVCTANICRSVMAEALLKHGLSENASDFEITSAGIDVIAGLVPDEFTRLVCSNHGLDVSDHEPRQLTPEMLGRCDIVFCLAEDHKRLIVGAYPKFESKVFLLKQFGLKDPVKKPSIDDPTGRSEVHYVRCFEEIEGEIRRMLPLLDQKGETEITKHPTQAKKRAL